MGSSVGGGPADPSPPGLPCRMANPTCSKLLRQAHQTQEIESGVSVKRLWGGASYQPPAFGAFLGPGARAGRFSAPRPTPALFLDTPDPPGPAGQPEPGFQGQEPREPRQSPGPRQRGRAQDPHDQPGCAPPGPAARAARPQPGGRGAAPGRGGWGAAVAGAHTGRWGATSLRGSPRTLPPRGQGPGWGGGVTALTGPHTSPWGILACGGGAQVPAAPCEPRGPVLTPPRPLQGLATWLSHGACPRAGPRSLPPPGGSSG